MQIQSLWHWMKCDLLTENIKVDIQTLIILIIWVGAIVANNK